MTLTLNKIKIIILTVILLIMASCSPTYAGQLAPNHYYTWAIPDPNIPNGSVITAVDITLTGLTSGTVHVWLCDNPPIGWIKNIGTMKKDTYLGQRTGNGDYSISLSSITLTDSWVYNIFDIPFQMSFTTEEEGGFELLMMNAALMEYIDYAGNNTPSGLLLYADDEAVTLDSITVALTIRSFKGEHYNVLQSYSVPVPKDLAVIEAWADSERLKLMHEYYEKMQELEIRIEMEIDN